MRVILLFLFSVILINTAFAQQKVFNIKKLGAVADGKTDNTRIIQGAIDRAFEAGGGTVWFPAGKFVTSVIHIRSNVTLYLAAGAELRASVKRITYGPGKASPLICADGQQNISITGKGTINGQGEALLKDIYRMLNDGTLKDTEWKTYNDWHQLRPEEDNRPKLIVFKNCDKVTLKNITIKNGLCWIQDYRSCTNMVIDSISVISNTFLNNDGIDLVDCKNVKLTNSFFNVADDGICLKSSDPQGACENIYIANCKIRSSASAFKMGTASWGGFKKIKVRNIYVYDTYRSAIAIESVDGAVIDGIDIRDVVAKNTGNAIFIRLGKRNKKSPPGSISNVYIGNVKCEVPAGKPDAGYHMEGPPEQFAHNIFPSSITGMPGFEPNNITLENIAINYLGTAQKQVAYFSTDSLDKVPEKAANYPEFSMFGELPASGFYVRHAAGIKMKNIDITYTGKDFRTPFIFDDVNKLSLEKVNVIHTDILPIMILNGVKDPLLLDIQPTQDNKKTIKVQ
ncbi:glycoside hydrolase family 28 protein [Mucilaginibacter dorajii]|uniref:Glycoside hydrolase family 28 protein n=1 Tax=Mucilaginibacter dorajii TaxID=692994 RepID=A0ABP7PBI5_9SPHI|nr:glycosyl hydrolase family 28 protein [Mucilaginibacter dorajii]MCS3734813.1 polygalacturonase [Mucilaginibacter dorajii]